MEKGEAIRAQAAGELVFCEAIPAVMSHGWNLQVAYGDGRRELIVGARESRPKWFGDAMTLLRFVETLGFDSVKVHVGKEVIAPAKKRRSGGPEGVNDILGRMQ